MRSGDGTTLRRALDGRTIYQTIRKDLTDRHFLISPPLYLFDVPRCETASLSVALSGRYVSSDRVLRGLVK